MTGPYTREAMSARFAQLGEKREAILAVSMPLREERDRLDAEHRAEHQKRIDHIRKVEADMAAIDTERGMLAKALGGKVLTLEPGKPPAE